MQLTLSALLSNLGRQLQDWGWECWMEQRQGKFRGQCQKYEREEENWGMRELMCDERNRE